MSLAHLIIYGDYHTLSQQIGQCGDLDYIDEYGYTPLIQCAIVDDIDKMKLMLKMKADVNKPDLTGRTALHWAVDNSNLAMCELLLEANANPNAYTLASLPVLVKPILRNDDEIKALLCRHGGDLTFAQDYINFKLLGHRYSLVGHLDIVDNEGRFTELSFEGFMLEFTLDVIRESLAEFTNNFAARHLQSQFDFINTLVKALSSGRELIALQQYLVDIDAKVSEVTKALRQDPIIIPVVQEGHAITLVRYRNFLAVCDRAQKESPDEPSVSIYYMNRPVRLNHGLLKDILYSRKSLKYVDQQLKEVLGLQLIAGLAIPLQTAGNCSWANVEACIPTLMVMMAMHEAGGSEKIESQWRLAMALYHEWQSWDKDRSLQFCIQSTSDASKARKAAKITALAAILFQTCHSDDAQELMRAEKIVPVVQEKGYEYVIDSYLDVYCRQKQTDAGNNLRRLLQYFKEDDDFYQVG